MAIDSYKYLHEIIMTACIKTNIFVIALFRVVLDQDLAGYPDPGGYPAKKTY